ncbi:MAG: ATP-dependent helicase HrpB [Bacteroides sp.]
MYTPSLLPYLHQLPVGQMADEVNRALTRHPRLVLTAPPGAGKSTLLPLTILQGFLQQEASTTAGKVPAEATPCGKILMLEPRRLAARQIAERMAAMLGERVGETVGYRVRFERCVSSRTRIEVLTEGILSRMLVDDPTLEGIAVVLFDEFHERNLTTDTAFALARASQQIIRPDLRILLMSATIDTSAICQAFDAPLLESQGHLFPVEVIHDEEATPATCATAVAQAVKRALHEHKGDILAFLPGQGEIMRCKELLDTYLGNDSAATMVCPLYGLMSSEAQRRAILPSPDGERKVVLATPIAETSLTIEGVRIVVDSGFCRKLLFDPRTSLSRLETVRISMDMARQRTGRAGRLAEGVCYRLWSRATELRMDDCRKPEIEEADLAPVVLDVAAWGETDLYQLPWLTPPPRAHVAHGRQLLQLLQAIDGQGAITPHGRELAHLPCHPRIAQMLTQASTPSQRSLATDVAALLDERDILPTDTADADLNSRIRLLRESRCKGHSRYAPILRNAEQYRRLIQLKDTDNSLPNPYDTGALIASAYPERIALRMDADTQASRNVRSNSLPLTDTVRYKLSNGEVATLQQADDLSGEELIAVASMDRRIFLAAPLRREAVADTAQWRKQLSWDSKQGEVIARRELRIGALTLEWRPIAMDEVRDEAVSVVCEAARRDGLSMFDFAAAEVQRLQLRLASLQRWHPEEEWPDLSTATLLERADEWLPLYIGKATTAQALKKIDLTEVMWGLLSYEQQLRADLLAPTHITVPTGSRIRVDYRPGAEAPIVSVRLQECFGMSDTPRVDEGRRPVLMELLSPGFKPVQLTKDLHSFWQTTYFEVRKELRRRYPKHFWPDNPTEAPATRGVKRSP